MMAKMAADLKGMVGFLAARIVGTAMVLAGMLVIAGLCTLTEASCQADWDA